MICPVFAVGRSQEVMIAIDELFRSVQVKPVPVWLDGMIQEATAIHASHPNYLTKALSKSLLKDDGENPFTSEWFRPVKGRELRESIVMDTSPCIVLATSGMLNGGPVMDASRTGPTRNATRSVSLATKLKEPWVVASRKDSAKFPCSSTARRRL